MTETEDLKSNRNTEIQKKQDGKIVDTRRAGDEGFSDPETAKALLFLALDKFYGIDRS